MGPCIDLCQFLIILLLTSTSERFFMGTNSSYSCLDLIFIVRVCTRTLPELNVLYIIPELNVLYLIPELNVLY